VTCLRPWPRTKEYVEENLVLPGGLPEPMRSWVKRAQAQTTWRLPPVTVAICTRDRPAELQRCIEQLRRLDYPQVQILIVDNGQDPVPAREIAERMEVDYVGSPVGGLSRARNTALEYAQHPWVAFTDDDCRPEPAWLKELVRPTQDPNCRCACGLVLPAQLENSAQISFELYGGLGRGYAAKIYDRGMLTASRVRPAETWRIGAGANMLLHRDFARWIGGFDQDLGPGPHSVGGCGEDTDLFYQVLRAGHNIHYNPRAIVHHAHRSSPPALRRQIYSYAVGHAAYHTRCFFKYGDHRSLLWVALHLPWWFTRNLRMAMRGATKYPASLVLLEIKGTIAGPFQYAAVKLRRMFKSWFAKRRARPAPDDLETIVTPTPETAYDATAGKKSIRAA
jgi:GT2 family glycosyltransferase